MGQFFVNKKMILALLAASLFPVASGVVAPPAQAQFSDSYNFLKAVRERKGEEAEKFLSEPGTVIVNTRDSTSGETALHIVITRRDSTWLGYLLQKGANPNLADKKGTTPLMLATQLNYVEGIDLLVKKKVQVDQTNRSGETALILAVQLRNAEAVRALLKAGANPDKKDSRAGYSARDYAKQDGRATAIVAILENNGKTDATKKPAELDFSGIGDPK
ncbi:MAG TPA: ankyrin repeat domain-containing protein [Sphingorhabdus lacus]|jgi:ankyrin repeat protein|uniref:Ankyrin repeat domain-containing protein n=1 Tax=Sphingorhabdus lacus TaxID=392610 RepID=A0A6I6L9L1_9SPHN|nr:ankyrin repeat domain-containing protein [Sphingorhabdus lacus]HNW17800.1 ankyrin repeat domain-containing protein [Sphingorhabdus lacus]HPV68095.1 ankyrin repeat domain-containing protein [Sphingorhabdus lacus]